METLVVNIASEWIFDSNMLKELPLTKTSLNTTCDNYNGKYTI